MKKILWVALFCCYAFSIHAEKKIAIFDYDDRLNEERTVAKHVQKKLLEVDKNFEIQQFTGKADPSYSLKLLKDLNNQNYDLIVTITSDALIIAQHLPRKTPFLFTNANNPQFLGIRDLQTPGKNFTGASYYVPVIRQLKMFKKIMPSMTTMGVIFDAQNKSRQVEARETRNIFSDFKWQFLYAMVQSKAELAEATQKLVDKGAEAIVITSSGTLYNNVDLMKPITDAAKIPIFSYHQKAVAHGAIASLSSDYYQMVDELVIPMAKEILYEGRYPGDMSVRFLKEHILSLNVSAAKTIGISIPEDLIETAQNKF